MEIRTRSVYLLFAAMPACVEMQKPDDLLQLGLSVLVLILLLVIILVAWRRQVIGIVAMVGYHKGGLAVAIRRRHFHTQKTQKTQALKTLKSCHIFIGLRGERGGHLV